jgi:hypothetical protein
MFNIVQHCSTLFNIVLIMLMHFFVYNYNIDSISTLQDLRKGIAFQSEQQLKEVKYTPNIEYKEYKDFSA